MFRRAKGTSDSISIAAEGVSVVKAQDFASRGASVQSEGSSKVYVNASQNLQVSAEGVSQVHYAGNPQKARINVTGVAKAKAYSPGRETTVDDNKRSFSIDWPGKNFDHWGGIGLTLNGYTTADFSTSLPASHSYMDLNHGRSIGWDLNLIQKNFHIWKNHINLCTGLGFQFSNYHFRNAVTLNGDSSYVSGYVDSLISYKKNSLRASYINIPLFIDFNTSLKAKKSFHIGFGAMAGYKLGSKTRQYYEVNEYEHSIRRKDDYNLNPFRVQAMALVGYGAFTLYGTYNVTTMFEKGKGPELYPFSIGVRIIPFD